MVFVNKRLGQIKECRGFALFPTKIDSSTTVWLQTYRRHKIWFQPMPTMMGISSPSWHIYDPIRNEVYDPRMRHGEEWRTYRNQNVPPPPPIGMLTAVMPADLGQRLGSAARYFGDFTAAQDVIMEKEKSAAVPKRQHMSRQDFMAKEIK